MSKPKNCVHKSFSQTSTRHNYRQAETGVALTLLMWIASFAQTIRLCLCICVFDRYISSSERHLHAYCVYSMPKFIILQFFSFFFSFISINLFQFIIFLLAKLAKKRKTNNCKIWTQFYSKHFETDFRVKKIIDFEKSPLFLTVVMENLLIVETTSIVYRKL